MSQDTMLALVSVLLILANAFFVAAEYALVGARRSRIQAIARKRKRSATGLLHVLDDIAPYVAGTQIGITMVGIAVGSLTEPFVHGWLLGVIGKGVPRSISFLISYLLITYVLVVVGELFPKYLAITAPERVALVTTLPLTWITKLLLPIVALAQWSASLLLRPFGIHPNAQRSEALSKDELVLLIRTGTTEGLIEKMQADVLAKALRLDKLDAKDIMIHRLDIKSLDVATPKDQLFARIAEIPHSRIPVHEGEVDMILGVVYLHDIVKSWGAPDFNLRTLVHEIAAVPETLTLDRIIAAMREAKSHIVLVRDEYGGTSGLITLEDVVEEVFGELEDHVETERPPVEILKNGRVTARADVRFDELVGKLGIDHLEPHTDTLATLIVSSLERVPRIGDKVPTELGTLVVENMARRRITRVTLIPRADLKPREQ